MNASPLTKRIKRTQRTGRAGRSGLIRRIALLGLLGAMLVQVGGTVSASAAPGNITAPFAPGEQWYVYQGYSSGTHTGTSQYGLDLTAGPSTTSTAGRGVRAPMAGAVAYWDAPFGNLCVNTPDGGSYTLTHINPSKTSGSVAAGEPLGSVAAAGTRNNNGVAHLHFEFWAGKNCYSHSAPIPMDSAHGRRMCGAPDFTAAGPNGGNGVWSGTYFTAQSCSNGTNPIGSLDGLDSPQPGTVHVRGWAMDPDAKTTSLDVHVYIGGPAGSGAPGFDTGLARTSRPDVGAAYPGAGDNHGYDVTLNSPQSGNVPVYVYAINAPGTGGDNVLLGTRSIAVTSGSPGGSFDDATSTIPGKVLIRGWGVDMNAKTQPIVMHLYVGGPAGSPGAAGYNIGLANSSRPDVNAAFPGVGNNHGYDRQVPIAQSGDLTVYLYGINIAGTPGDNVLLGSRQVHVLAAGQPMTSTAAPRTTGRTRSRSILTTDGGKWSQPGPALRYQWYRNSTPIAGATRRSYTLGRLDIGRRVRVRVTALKDGYRTATAWSAPTRTITR